MAFLLAVGVCDAMVPSRVTFFSDELDGSANYSFVTFETPDDSVEASLSVTAYRDGGIYTEYESNAKLFGVLPLKTVSVGVVDRVRLYPGGMPFGVKFYTDGVLVVGVSAVTTDAGEVSPANEAGIKVKDVITKIDGIKVTSVEEVTRILEDSEGKTLEVTCKRGNEEFIAPLSTVYSTPDGSYKAGLWIRDSTAGIGTVTYIDPTTLEFAGLGHGICDVDTGDLMPLLRANVVDVTLSGIVKGKSGSPGELRGYFDTEMVGSLTKNTRSGVFGTLCELPQETLGEPMPIALSREVEPGAATILCSVDGGEVREYAVEITKMRDRESDVKNFIIKVTDPELLELTGGIVQGMSGSTIIQNGKIVGAVTHVLVNDPTSGYGIFIENMLAASK